MTPLFSQRAPFRQEHWYKVCKTWLIITLRKVVPNTTYTGNGADPTIYTIAQDLLPEHTILHGELCRLVFHQL